MDLPTLANNARTELLDEVIPFWLQHGVDSDHGGFICGLSHKGNVVDASNAQELYPVDLYIHIYVFINI